MSIVALGSDVPQRCAAGPTACAWCRSGCADRQTLCDAGQAACAARSTARAHEWGLRGRFTAHSRGLCRRFAEGARLVAEEARSRRDGDETGGGPSTP